ncbi:MAG: T9SS type A sorting domain-containing protein, partial [Patescibacteria group bacterium]|nr:T9SS type A sorting domain-containing protein [Patescibacteria group bacterium]
TLFGTGEVYVPLVGDFNGDGKDDVGLHKNTTGQWYVALSSGSSFVPTGTVWLSTYAIEVGGSGKLTMEPDGALPVSFTLNQNYPNPFNATTVISYSLPVAAHVRLDVYNILGQKVATLVDAQHNAGQHNISWVADQYSSGVYFYRIQTPEATQTKKMLLLK